MKRWILAFIIAVIILVPLELWLVSGHGAFPWSNLSGFFAILGFIGCLALIGFAKLLGHYWLQRKEDYYDRNDDDK